MFNRVLNLPFKVLGNVARAVQERENRAQRERAEATGEDEEQPDVPVNFGVPPDFDPGPIRVQAESLLQPPTSGQARLLVDVGTADEWAAGHAENAMHLPLRHLDIRLAELPPDTDIVLYARNPADSDTAVRFLRHRGLDDTWSLDGGLAAWTASRSEIP